ncbi:transglutaminase family protein [Dyadobacter sediminis]|uniref:Transglutaminase family protein n=1 Tax=Dyadobacter sediminis TaxID=1493691 RepID=A0A5R9K8U3_9BACT|nr:transglutaminase family protein [Dyadobacter sediminis]TLU90492.1 transglutaminase family protein [Dyadobacter sediminis]GGC08157.1 transglutaminase [Dyadobacter sediminis]
MKLKVRHTLEYRYDSPVVLTTHVLYLYPRSYPHQRLLDYSLYIDPLPSKVVKNVDAEGNVQHLVYFYNQPCSRLLVEAEMTVSSEPVNVFDFVLFPFETSRIPFLYDNSTFKYLIPYLDKSDLTAQVETFAKEIADQVDGQTIPFLVELSRHISSTFTYRSRAYGSAFAPAETLDSHSGSCREFARLYISACRSAGIAARFVSGYLYGNPQQAHELHAWAEVYLPGAGWRGFDPTEGKSVVDRHISMGASADFDKLAPVMGSFLGYSGSRLLTNVRIELL